MSAAHSNSQDESNRFQIDIDRMRQDRFGTARWVVWQHSHNWRPPTDVFETDEAVVVRVEVAGMKEAEFNVTLQDQLLVITGTRVDPSSKVAYHQLEVRYGEFRTEVALHWVVDEANIAATYQDGFLVVVLPKGRARRVKVIDVSDRGL
jgi:HSP20 family protein